MSIQDKNNNNNNNLNDNKKKKKIIDVSTGYNSKTIRAYLRQVYVRCHRGLKKDAFSTGMEC